jgi:colanic acid biosynthesis glycosyl transferase WcaI
MIVKTLPTRRESLPTFAVFSQTYVPDPASVGQHMADMAAEMVRRGYRVVVYTASRGYEDPSQRYPAREVIDGVEIRRLPLSSFGKQSVAMRLVAGTLFMLQCMIRGLFIGRLAAVLVSTSPPMCSVVGVFLGTLRRVQVKFWVMDLNPDQMIAVGKLKPGSFPVRVFDFLNRMILRRADDVIALDRFMADLLNRKVDVGRKMTVLPPWPHEDHLESIDHQSNPFRQRHGLSGKRVIMYSGNHGFSTPITTILQAALRLRDREDIVFLFVGGGVGKKEVERVIEQEKPANVRSLPYQPLAEIKYSLSAADVHLVSVGDAFVGIVHPCKVYGAMALSRPILLLGPDPSHVSDLVAGHCIGWHVRHGDVEGAVQAVLRIAEAPADELAAMGQRARRIIDERFNKQLLLGKLCDVLERGISARPAGPVRSTRVEAAGQSSCA